ncbi:MAG: PAS domain-containing protein [Halieaceae bacterium]|jgi:photoactive yellow protein|nr:PAS domain-containing protein [Halieaceae bacterium]
MAGNISLEQLDALSAEQLDGIEYGVIRMTHGGIVTDYNSAEQRLSGLQRAQVLGQNFFAEVAPCTNNFMVAQKYLEVTELDETIDYVFTLRMKPTPVSLRMLRSASSDFQYLLVWRREVA